MMYADNPADVERLTRPTVVCLCGSTRFWQEFADVAWAETLAGRIVVRPDVDMKRPGDGYMDAAAVKVDLDKLHRAKIRLADEVLVVGDYIGESTTSEIEYARSLHKTVRYTHPEVDPARQQDQAPEATCRLVDIGGETIRVQGTGEMSEGAREALTALVGVAREQAEAERREQCAMALYDALEPFAQQHPWSTRSPGQRAIWYENADDTMKRMDAWRAETSEARAVEDMRARAETLNRQAADRKTARQEPTPARADDPFPSPEQAATLLETAAMLLQDRAQAAQHALDTDGYWKGYDPATAWGDGYDNGMGGITVPYVSLLPPQAGIYLARLLLTHAAVISDEGAALWDAVALAQIIVKSAAPEAPRG